MSTKSRALFRAWGKVFNSLFSSPLLPESSPKMLPLYSWVLMNQEPQNEVQKLHKLQHHTQRVHSGFLFGKMKEVLFLQSCFKDCHGSCAQHRSQALNKCFLRGSISTDSLRREKKSTPKGTKEWDLEPQRIKVCGRDITYCVLYTSLENKPFKC